MNEDQFGQLAAKVDSLLTQSDSILSIVKDQDVKTLLAVVEKLAQKVDLLSARIAALEGAPPAEKEWLTAREVAALLNISESRVYQLRYSGRLTPIKRGRMYIFNREQVNAFEP